MSIPGTNPFTPKMIKQNCVSWSYAPNDCYEQMYHYFKPRAELYFNTLKAKLAKGENSMKWEDIAPEGDKIERKWVEQPITVPASVAFKGTPMEAIKHALAATKSIGKIPTFKSGWQVDRTLTTECAAAPVNSGLEVITAGDGPAKTEEAAGSLCWTLGPKSASAQPYLYVSADNLMVYDLNGRVTLTVEYLDEGEGVVGIDYDSSDTKATLGGAYKPMSELFKLTGTGQWKTAAVVLPDAKLSDRQNSGADFRLYMGEGSLRVRKISLSRAK
jgi:hypothetical protein